MVAFSCSLNHGCGSCTWLYAPVCVHCHSDPPGSARRFGAAYSGAAGSTRVQGLHPLVLVPSTDTHIPIATSPRSRVVICQSCCPPLCRLMLLGPSGALARGDNILTKSREGASITLVGPLQSTERPRIACTGAGSRTSSCAGGSLTSSRSASRFLRRPPPARRCPRNRPGAAEAACADGLD
jgi:hypothetical protein